jgi:hypothetical protein
VGTRTQSGEAGIGGLAGGNPLPVILSEAKDLCSWLSTEVQQLLFLSLGRRWTRARECRLDRLSVLIRGTKRLPARLSTVGMFLSRCTSLDTRDVLLASGDNVRDFLGVSPCVHEQGCDGPAKANYAVLKQGTSC